MKRDSVSRTAVLGLAAVLFLAPAGAWAGSFRIGGHPPRLSSAGGPVAPGRHLPVGSSAVVQQTAIIVTNPDARPMDHLPFLHPFPRTVDVPRSTVVIETHVSVSGANGHAAATAAQWWWQPGQWVWGEQGWVWVAGNWVRRR